jgi:hypothetical protein
VLGYRRINGYTGTDLRRIGHLFFGKNLLYSYTYPPPPAPRTRRPVKFKFQKFPPVHIKSIPVPAEKKQKKKQKHKKISAYLYRGTRDGHGYETVPVPRTRAVVPVYPRRARVGYSFEKKICLPVPAVPAAVVPDPCPRYPLANH